MGPGSTVGTSISSSSPTSTPLVPTTKSDNAKAITGTIIGGTVLFAVLVVFFLFWRLGQRSSGRAVSKNSAIEPLGGDRDPSGSINETYHSHSSSTLSPVSDHPDRVIKMPAPVPTCGAGTSQRLEDGRTGDGTSNRPASELPDLRNHGLGSMPGIHESTEAGLPLQNSNTPTDNRRLSDTFLAMLPLPAETRFAVHSVPPSPGRRASRKPVPTYDTPSFNRPTTSDDPGPYPIGFAAEHFDKPLHYLIPDMPPPRKDLS